MDSITPKAAEKIVGSQIHPLLSEKVPFREAYGRILQEPILADRDFPPFDRVMMDGIAIALDSVKGTSYRSLGIQRAGMAAQTLKEGRYCFEVMTGAMLPIGADTVIPVEQIAESDGEFTLRPDYEPQAGQFVHRQGSDQISGDLILKEGTWLGGKEIAIVATCGYAEVAVNRIPRITIVSTGDELVPVEEIPSAFQIRTSNVYALESACRSLPIPTSVKLNHLPDDRKIIADQMGPLLEEADLLLFSGGISKGKYDFLQDVLEEAGAVKHFQWVRQRPGKPLWFGTAQSGTAIFALPGNPNSTLTCFYRYVVDSIRYMAGLGKQLPETGRLDSPFEFIPPLALFLPVTVKRIPGGSLLMNPLPTQNSGDLAGLAHSDGFIELPADQNEFPVGFSAPFYPW